MADKTYDVLFICTGNSARSVIAEGLLNHMGGGRFKAYELMPALPLERLDTLAIQREVKDTGTR